MDVAQSDSPPTVQPLGAGARTKILTATQWQLMRWKFSRHRLAVASLVVLGLLYVCVLFAEFVAPYDPRHHDKDFIHAPPQRLRFFDLEGALSSAPVRLPGGRLDGSGVAEDHLHVGPVGPHSGAPVRPWRPVRNVGHHPGGSASVWYPRGEVVPVRSRPPRARRPVAGYLRQPGIADDPLRRDRLQLHAGHPHRRNLGLLRGPDGHHHPAGYRVHARHSHPSPVDGAQRRPAFLLVGVSGVFRDRDHTVAGDVDQHSPGRARQVHGGQGRGVRHGCPIGQRAQHAG